MIPQLGGAATRLSRPDEPIAFRLRRPEAWTGGLTIFSGRLYDPP
jgi:hypothetical protein